MTTPNLQLPEVPQAIQEASDEINAGFQTLDAIVQLAVLDKDRTTPPAGAVQGDRYIVAATAAGDWFGRERAIAFLAPDGWKFYVPRPGWRAYVIDEDSFYLYSGTQWDLDATGGGDIPVAADILFDDALVSPPFGATNVQEALDSLKNLGLQADQIGFDGTVVGGGVDDVQQAIDSLAVGLAGRVVDVQIFTSTGTWNKPSGARVVEVFCAGGGGGGGSGRKGAVGTGRNGGGGGGAGAFSIWSWAAQDLPSSVLCTVGAAGTGGAQITVDTTNGANGVAGGDSTFGSLLKSSGGLPGNAGGLGGGGGGGIGGATGFNTGNPGAAGQSGIGGDANSVALTGMPNYRSSGGGGGGGASAATPGTEGGGGKGGPIDVISLLGGAGGAVRSNGSNGLTTGANSGPATGGGGGGGANTSGVSAGDGGNGAIPGGGGGGGGGSTNGVGGHSGKGGDGGRGVIVVTTYF
jgi:hypothetical protein